MPGASVPGRRLRAGAAANPQAMSPALWGGVSALGFGGADFMGRFSSRAIGYASACLGVVMAGAVVLTAWVWITDAPLVWTTSHLWLLAVNGVFTTITTLPLYKGLARGPVSIVAPIVAAHPALVVALAVVLGSRPSAVQWGAMGLTLVGALVIARAARTFEEPGVMSRPELRVTIWIACAAT